MSNTRKLKWIFWNLGLMGFWFLLIYVNVQMRLALEPWKPFPAVVPLCSCFSTDKETGSDQKFTLFGYIFEKNTGTFTRAAKFFFPF